MVLNYLGIDDHGFILIGLNMLDYSPSLYAEFIYFHFAYNKIYTMNKNLLNITLSIIVFIVTTHGNKWGYLDTVSYNIVPQFPSEAFLGQYYTCRFRVNGMQKPTFTFLNLPSFFTSSPSGMIQGIPDRIGTFEIMVAYEQIYQIGEKTILLRVVEPYYNEKALNLKKSQTKLIPIITDEMNYIYRVYENVFLNLNKFNNKKNYWTYLNLPQTLQATQEGVITGLINKEGYYSFGAICTDQHGYSQDYFFNLNIQPFVFTGFKKQPTFADLYIQNRIHYNSIYIQNMYNQAAKNLINAFKNANQTAINVLKLKNQFIKTKVDIQKAKTQLGRQVILVDSLNVDKTLKILEEKSAKQNLVKHDDIFKLANTAFQQALNKTNQVKIQLENAMDKFNKAQKMLNQSSKIAIQAQNQLRTALSEVEKIKRQLNSIQQDIQIYIQDISAAKKALQNAKSQKILRDVDVNNAKAKKDIAQGTNDQATAKLNAASVILQKQKIRLTEANTNISAARLDKNRADVQLGTAKFNLNQALNQLLVAQAAKQQADKAMLIASTQASEMPEGSTTYIFGGCDSYNYPTITGTAQIIKNIDSKGGCYELNSGFSIIPGKCDANSVAVQGLKQGDTITFEGYIKDGKIHGVKISNN